MIKDPLHLLCHPAVGFIWRLPSAAPSLWSSGSVGRKGFWLGFLRMFAYIHPKTNLCIWAQALAKSSDHSGPKMMEEVCDPMNLLFSRGALIPNSKAIIHSLSPEELPVNL